MDQAELRRALFSIRGVGGEEGLRVDIVKGGRVRLRLLSADGTRDLFCDTLEDLALLVAAEPALSGELYEQLVWELDLMGLRGE